MQVGAHVFIRTKFDSLDGKTIVAFTADNGFCLRASRMGVEVMGEILIEGELELQQFAQLMSDSWTEHRKLKPKLASSLSGH